MTALTARLTLVYFTGYSPNVDSVGDGVMVG